MYHAVFLLSKIKVIRCPKYSTGHYLYYISMLYGAKHLQ